MKIGMTIANIGSQIQFIDKTARIPAIFRIGSAVSLIQRPDQQLLGSLEFSHPPDNAERLNIGTEYSLQEPVPSAWRV